MSFQGADTAQLRQHAERLESCGRTMLETSASLSIAVMSVAWQGPDADGLRSRWRELENRINTASERASALGREMTEHAAEQDSASAADGGGDASSLWEQLGLPDLRSLVTTTGSRLSDLIGIAKDLSGVLAPDGLGGGNPFLAALDPGRGRGAGTSAPEGIPDLIDALFGNDAKGDGAEDGDDSRFTHEPGTDTTESFVTVELDDGTKVKLSEKDGTVTREFTKAHEHEIPLGSDKAGLTVSTRTADTYSISVNPDGSLKYTFTQTLENGGAAKGDAKVVSGSVSHSSSDAVTYSVDVPAGTSVAEALTINPYDPSSIPQGTEVSIDTSHETKTGVDVQVDSRRLPPFVFGGESGDGIGTTTVISRNDDGTLSVTAGPTESDSDSAYAGLGTKDLNFSMTSARESTGAKLDHAEFADTPEGREAFTDAARTGRLPESTSDAVTQRYTETREAVTAEQGMKLHWKSIDAGSSSNTFASERIEREYSDGTKEWDVQILPSGIDNGSWARASGGTERETTYQVHMIPEANEDLTDVESYYGRNPRGPVDLTFTDAEMEQARTNSNTNSYSDFTNNAEYAAGVVQRSQSQSVDMAVRDLHNDYNNYVPGPDGGTVDSHEVPGTLGG